MYVCMTRAGHSEVCVEKSSEDLIAMPDRVALPMILHYCAHHRLKHDRWTGRLMKNFFEQQAQQVRPRVLLVRAGIRLARTSVENRARRGPGAHLCNNCQHYPALAGNSRRTMPPLLRAVPEQIRAVSLAGIAGVVRHQLLLIRVHVLRVRGTRHEGDEFQVRNVSLQQQQCYARVSGARYLIPGSGPQYGLRVQQCSYDT